MLAVFDAVNGTEVPMISDPFRVTLRSWKTSENDCTCVPDWVEDDASKTYPMVCVTVTSNLLAVIMQLIRREDNKKQVRCDSDVPVLLVLNHSWNRQAEAITEWIRGKINVSSVQIYLKQT